MTLRSDSTAPSPAGWSAYPTDLGPAWAAWDERGLSGLGLPATDPPEGRPSPPPADVEELQRSLAAYFVGEGPLPSAGDALARASTTPFLGAVYARVCAIPAGEVASYGEVAAAAGRPGAARAVGAAMAANRYAPIIPCHRVVGSDRALRGYGGGLDMKRRLLDMEHDRA